MAEQKKTRNRSPIHPSMALGQAVDLAEKVCGVHGFSLAPMQTVIADLGFSAKSSSGIRAVASLIHFGLAEDKGAKEARRVALTGCARNILRGRKEGRRDSASLQAAALNPTIYRTLWEDWSKRPTWPAQSVKEWELEHDHGFNPTAIAAFIEDFEATLDYAGLDRSGSARDTSSDTAEDEAPVDPSPDDRSKRDRDKGTGDVPKETPMATPGADHATVQSFQFPVGKGATVVLSVPVPLSPASFKQVKAWLDLMEPAITDAGGGIKSAGKV